jgi:hypothetical protein
MKPYDQDDIDSLTPLLGALPDPITPAAPMTNEAFTNLQTILPQEGDWTFTPSSAPVTCLDNNQPQSIAPALPGVAQALSGTITLLPAGESASGVDATGDSTTVTAQELGDAIVLKAAGLPNPIPMARSDLNVYTGNSGYGELSLLVLSPTTAVLRTIIPLTTNTGDVMCNQTEIFLTGSTGQ